MKYNNLYLIFFTILTTILGACNSDWTEEQYTQYVSFKAPLSGNPGVTRIRLKYRADSVVNYKLPLMVSGSTMNSNDIMAHIDLDVDTLNDFNKNNYYSRTDLYYKLLEPRFYNILSKDVIIPKGECQGFIDIDFDLRNLDLVDKWILPLIVKDDPSYNYHSHPRKNYNNALLWITPFNDYSGTYGATNVSIYTDTSDNPIVVNTREVQVVDDNTVFFYAGAIKENRVDRRFFKIYLRFNPLSETDGDIDMWSDNEDLQLEVIGNPTYKITELMDTSRPYLLRRTTTVNFEYRFVDPNETPGYTMNYNVKGSMSMERRINTLIPDEEYAIEW